jgi:hypothetical protein
VPRSNGKFGSVNGKSCDHQSIKKVIKEHSRAHVDSLSVYERN